MSIPSKCFETLARYSVVASICAFVLAPTTANAEIRDHTVRLSYVNSAASGAVNGADKFAELVKQKSGGKINIKLFPSGVLGGDVQVISAMQGGTVDMSVMGADALVGVVKDFVLFGFPYLFDNDKEASAVIDGPVGKQIFDTLATKGLIGMPISAYGFRQLTNNKHPVNKIEDMRGLKLRVMQSPFYVDFINAVGSNAVALSFTEVYNAMETKIIDGMTNTALIASTMKVYEVQKYLSLTRHMYNHILLLVSKKSWDKFNDEEKALLTQAANETKGYQRNYLPEITSKSLADLKSHGMSINDVSPAEIARFREAAKPIVEKYALQLSPGLMQLTKDTLTAMRK
jgi:TRAP-type transport system periplasmic protein